MVVKQIDSGSIAEECGISPGDVLLSIDGHKLRDYIDYIYELSGDEILLAVRKKGRIRKENKLPEQVHILFCRPDAEAYAQDPLCQRR